MSLQSDIADYRAEHAGMLHVAESFYRGLPFAEAITYDASAAGPYGRIDPHQHRKIQISHGYIYSGWLSAKGQIY
jgi:hypothetical protein